MCVYILTAHRDLKSKKIRVTIIELPAKLLDHFWWSNESNINQLYVRALFLIGVCWLLYFIKPIMGNRHGPGVSSRANQGRRTHDWESPTYLLALSSLRQPGVARSPSTSPPTLTMSLAVPAPSFSSSNGVCCFVLLTQGWGKLETRPSSSRAFETCCTRNPTRMWTFVKLPFLSGFPLKWRNRKYFCSLIYGSFTQNRLNLRSNISCEFLQLWHRTIQICKSGILLYSE